MHGHMHTHGHMDVRMHTCTQTHTHTRRVWRECEIPILWKKGTWTVKRHQEKRGRFAQLLIKYGRNVRSERESVEVDIVFVKYKMETESVKSGGC